jgi:hypothetical protein
MSVYIFIIYNRVSALIISTSLNISNKSIHKNKTLLLKGKSKPNEVLFRYYSPFNLVSGKFQTLQAFQNHRICNTYLCGE